MKVSKYCTERPTSIVLSITVELFELRTRYFSHRSLNIIFFFKLSAQACSSWESNYNTLNFSQVSLRLQCSSEANSYIIIITCCRRYDIKIYFFYEKNNKKSLLFFKKIIGTIILLIYPFKPKNVSGPTIAS